MRGWAAFAVVTGLPALLHVALAAMVGAESDGGGPILASAIIVSAMAGVFAAWSRPALSFAVAVAWPSFMAWSRMYWKIGVSSPAPAAAVFLRNWQGLDLPPSAAYALVLAAAHPCLDVLAPRGYAPVKRRTDGRPDPVDIAAQAARWVEDYAGREAIRRRAARVVVGLSWDDQLLWILGSVGVRIE